MAGAASGRPRSTGPRGGNVNAVDVIETKLLEAGKIVKRRGDTLTAQCPAHNDNNPSLSVAPGTKGRDVILRCHAGCEATAIMAALGLDWRDLSPRPETMRETGRYHYVDVNGGALFDVVRFEPKTFRQQRYDGAWGLGDTPRVLYHLDEIHRQTARAGPVWVAEGEKDVDAIRARGLVATCNPMGAGKFTFDHASSLIGASLVTVVADRDEPGRAHARLVAGFLHLAGVPWRVVEAAKGKDAHDHFVAGLGPDDFVTVDLDPDPTPKAVHPLSRFLIDWPDFWATDHLADDWLIEPLIARGRAHAVYAGAKIGKSYVLLGVIAAACAGHDVLKHRGGPVTVLYVDYEMTSADLRDRLTEFGYGPSDDLTRLYYALLPSLPPLDTREGGEALVEAAQAVGADLVVIDTTGRAVEGEENSADTYRAFYRHCGQLLKQTGIAWVRLDHAGKEAERGQRGSSGKNDDVDVVWRLTRTDSGVTLAATHRRMSWVPERLDIGIADDGTGTVRFSVDADVWPADTKTIALELEALGVPTTASANAAARALKASGNGRRTIAVKAAQKWRKSADWTREPPREPPSYPQAGTTLGTTGDYPVKPQVRVPGTTLGTTGNHLPPANGNHPGVLRRDPGGSQPVRDHHGNDAPEPEIRPFTIGVDW